MDVKFKKLHANAILPQQSTEHAAGFDIRACIPSSWVIKPGEIVKVPTGLAIETPVGYASLLLPRSGLALKHGITLINAPGLIDADYRGEVCVALVNHSDKTFTIEPDDRIAQLMIVPFVAFSPVEADELSSTTRGEGGFGHSGVK